MRSLKQWRAEHPEKAREHARHQNEKRRNNPEHLAQVRSFERARQKALNELLRENADRHQCRWTPEEDQVLLKSGLVSKHVAQILGRTYRAVFARRARLRKEGETHE